MRTNHSLSQLKCVLMDNNNSMSYSKGVMVTKLTIYLLLCAIAVQGVFGGLQDSVLICLGGGHEHEVAELIEYCEFECTHHSNWPAPITTSEDIGNCDCTDFEFGLIVLLTTPRAHDSFMIFAPATCTFESFTDQTNSQTWRGPPKNDDDFGMMQRIAVIRSTRLRV